MSTRDKDDGLSDTERKSMTSVLEIHALPIPPDDEPECVECGASYRIDYGSEPSRLCHPCAQLIADIDAFVLAKAVERLSRENAALKAERDYLQRYPKADDKCPYCWPADVDVHVIDAEGKALTTPPGGG